MSELAEALQGLKGFFSPGCTSTHSHKVNHQVLATFHGSAYYIGRRTNRLNRCHEDSFNLKFGNMQRNLCLITTMKHPVKL